MRRTAVVFVTLLAGSAVAAPADETCLIQESNVTWAAIKGAVHGTWAEAAKAAGVAAPEGDADPFGSEAARLVSTPRGDDLFVKGQKGVIRFPDRLSKDARTRLNHWVMSSARGPWVVVSMGTQDIIEEGDEEPGLPAHPESDYTQWLIDGRTGRVVVQAAYTLPHSAGPDAPEWELTDTEFTYRTYDESGTRPFADVARCAGAEGDSPQKLASPWVELGRKLTKSRPSDAWTAFTQALAFAPEAAEAWSGRGYATLQLYLERRKTSSSSIDYIAALEDFDKAVKHSTDARFLAQVWYNIGEAHRLGCESNLPKYKREPLGKAADAYKRSLAYAEREPVIAKLAEVEALLAGLPSE
ncbi:MAG: hypothetical protein AMXMBFR64_08290 [Myxococcales bacterium]